MTSVEHLLGVEDYPIRQHWQMLWVLQCGYTNIYRWTEIPLQACQEGPESSLERSNEIRERLESFLAFQVNNLILYTAEQDHISASLMCVKKWVSFLNIRRVGQLAETTNDELSKFWPMNFPMVWESAMLRIYEIGRSAYVDYYWRMV